MSTRLLLVLGVVGVAGYYLTQRHQGAPPMRSGSGSLADDLGLGRERRDSRSSRRSRAVRGVLGGLLGAISGVSEALSENENDEP